MNAKTVVAMNQLMSRLVHGICIGNADTLLDQCFWDHDDVTLNVSDLNVHVTGLSKIKDFYKENQYRDGLYGAFHMLHSNSYKTEEKNAIAQWNTHSMWLVHDKSGNPSGMRFGYFRFMGFFSMDKDVWKLDRLDVHALIIFPTWENSIHQIFEQKSDISQGDVETEDYIHIRNLVGRYVQEGPGRAISKFAKDSFKKFYVRQVTPKEVTDYKSLKCFFADMDAKEHRDKLYIYHMLTTAPIITVEEDGIHAKARMMAQLIYFEPIEDAKNYVQLGIGWVDTTFVKEAGKWKIEELVVEPYALMNQMNMEIQLERPMAMRTDDNWPLAPIEQQNSAKYASELFGAESLLPHWTERLKRGDTADFVTKYMDNAIDEISMGMSGPRHYGHDAVFKSAGNPTSVFEGSMYKRFPQFHTGGSPVMELNEDGIHAEISWMEYGWGYVGYGVLYSEEEKHRMYRPMIGQYYHKFVKDNDVWKMYYFGWKPTIQSIPYWEYETDDVKGWASKTFKHPWPLPLEEYIEE